MAVGVAVQAMLEGMPLAADLRRTEVDGEVLIAVGNRVLFRYELGDAALRNLAAVTLPEWGFTGRRVAEVLGVTEEYVSMLRGRVRRDGSAALMRRQGRPPALAGRQVATARAMRADGRPDTAIANGASPQPDQRCGGGWWWFVGSGRGSHGQWLPVIELPPWRWVARGPTHDRSLR